MVDRNESLPGWAINVFLMVIFNIAIFSLVHVDPIGIGRKRKIGRIFPWDFQNIAIFPLGLGGSPILVSLATLRSAEAAPGDVLFHLGRVAWLARHQRGEISPGGFPPPGLWNGRSIEKPRKKAIVWYFDLLQTEDLYIFIPTRPADSFGIQDSEGKCYRCLWVWNTPFEPWFGIESVHDLGRGWGYARLRNATDTSSINPS